MLRVKMSQCSLALLADTTRGAAGINDEGVGHEVGLPNSGFE